MSFGKSADNKELYQQALKYFKECLYPQAIAILDKLVDQGGLQGHLSRFYHSRACRLHAEQLISQRKYEEATRYLHRAMESHTVSAAIISFLAQCYQKQGNYSQASQEYTHLHELNAGDPAIRIKEALSYFLAGNGTLATKILKSLVRQYPNNYEINYNLGLIFSAEDHPRHALPYLHKACRLRPESVDANWKLGLAEGLVGHLPEAIFHLQRAHKLEPENNWLLAHLGLAVQQARHQGMEINPEIVSVEQVTVKSEDIAVDQLAAMIIENPDFVTAFLDLPQTDIDDQIFSSLLKIIMRALERNPEYADLHYHCSCIYQRLGQSEQAIAESQKAIELNPNYITALIQLAKLYAQTNQDQIAIDRLKEAIRQGANYADVHYLLGNMYRKQGSIEQARTHYEKALGINREFHAAKDALESLAA